MPEQHEFYATPLEAGSRLDVFLTAQIPALSRSRLQALIKEAHVTLNGIQAKPHAKLRPGDHILVREPAPQVIETAAEAIPLSVLYEDADLIVIDKPPGMVVHPAVGHRGGTVVNALLHHCAGLSVIGGEERPGIVHRLDKDTSGCLVAAKNDIAHRALARQFAGREVTKIYLAIASGPFPKQSGTVSAPIARHPIHRQRMAVVEGGRAARTDWRVLHEWDGIGLVECTLHSGRTHQIRVHLKHVGHPLLGDTVYGKPAGYPRQMLHAWRLGFAHPRTGDRVDCTAPVPEDFNVAHALSLRDGVLGRDR